MAPNYTPESRLPSASYRAMVSVTGGQVVAPQMMLPKRVCHRRAPAWDHKRDTSIWRRCGVGTWGPRGGRRGACSRRRWRSRATIGKHSFGPGDDRRRDARGDRAEAAPRAMTPRWCGRSGRSGKRRAIRGRAVCKRCSRCGCRGPAGASRCRRPPKPRCAPSARARWTVYWRPTSARFVDDCMGVPSQARC